MRLRRRQFLAGVAGLAAGLVTACLPSLGVTGQRSNAAPGGRSPVAIRYWDWWVTQGPTIDREIALFQERYPHIRVEKTTQVYDRYPELVQLAFKGGNAPDVLLIPYKPNLLDQVRLDWYLPLNPWATEEWRAMFPEGSFAEGSNIFDGQLYTVPYEGPAPWLQLYLNARVFREAGLVDAQGNPLVPRTWDDVRTYARTITEKGGGRVYGYGFGGRQGFTLPWQLMMTQMSGAPGGSTGFDWREGRYTWASNPVYAQWVEFFLAMKGDGSIIPNAMTMDDEMARAAFADGKFGMLVGGVWVQTGWEQTHPSFRDYLVLPLPWKDPAGPASYFYRTPGGIGWAISSQTKHPEEAWLWFQWLNSPEAAERWVRDNQGSRVFPEVNRPEFAKTPQFRQYLELAEYVKLGPAPYLEHPEMAEVKEQQTLPNIDQILQGIFTGQVRDYEAALADLETRQNAELERAIAEAQARGVAVRREWWRVADWDPTRDYRT